MTDMNVLFLCHANMCRSPLAEGLLKYILKNRNIKAEVDSAGFEAFHINEPPDNRAIQKGLKHGVDITRKKVRLFTHEDFDRFDLIIAMDNSNRQILETMAANDDQLNQIHMMREYDPQGSSDQDVPDPYYGGVEGFENTFQIVRRATLGLLEALESDRLAP